MTKQLKASKGERALLYKYIEGIMGRELDRETELPYLSEMVKLVIKTQLHECELLHKRGVAKYRREQSVWGGEKGKLLQIIRELKEE